MKKYHKNLFEQLTTGLHLSINGMHKHINYEIKYKWCTNI